MTIEERDKRNKDRRDYIAKHPEKVRQWYLNCRANGTHSSVNGKNLEWYYKNHEHAKKSHREWSKTSHSHVLKYLKKRKDIPQVKIARITRDRLHGHLRRMKLQKSTNTMDLVGCDWITLSQWIESQFDKKMSWSNHGRYGWHVDHIRPCSSFDLIDPLQLRQCFHYTNLQPLWSQDNWSKHDRYNGGTI